MLWLVGGIGRWREGRGDRQKKWREGERGRQNPSIPIKINSYKSGQIGGERVCWEISVILHFCPNFKLFKWGYKCIIVIVNLCNIFLSLFFPSYPHGCQNRDSNWFYNPRSMTVLGRILTPKVPNKIRERWNPLISPSSF